MTEKDLEEFEKEFGFKLLPIGFKKPLSEITKEEYKERIEYLYNAIINDNSNDDDDLMTTKEEYIKALNGMEEVYDNLDGCMSAMNMFKEGVNLLAGLINEHFEEKTETNYEHFKDEVIENCSFTFALVGGKLHECREKIEEWLKSPYKKPTYKLNKFEYDLLQSYSDIYSFNAFNSLSWMKEKGYFKGIDDNKTIGYILDNCEVIK